MRISAHCSLARGGTKPATASPRLSLRVGERLRLALATSLSEDGQEDGNWDPQEWRTGGARAKNSRLETFEYVMYGKVYHMEGDERDLDGQLYDSPASLHSASLFSPLLSSASLPPLCSVVLSLFACPPRASRRVASCERSPARLGLSRLLAAACLQLLCCVRFVNPPACLPYCRTHLIPSHLPVVPAPRSQCDCDCGCDVSLRS